MSDTLIALENALHILRVARLQCAENQFAWSKLYDAYQHVERQIADYFKEEQN